MMLMIWVDCFINIIFSVFDYRLGNYKLETRMVCRVLQSQRIACGYTVYVSLPRRCLYQGLLALKD